MNFWLSTWYVYLARNFQLCKQAREVHYLPYFWSFPATGLATQSVTIMLHHSNMHFLTWSVTDSYIYWISFKNVLSCKCTKCNKWLVVYILIVPFSCVSLLLAIDKIEPNLSTHGNILLDSMSHNLRTKNDIQKYLDHSRSLRWQITKEGIEVIQKKKIMRSTYALSCLTVLCLLYLCNTYMCSERVTD